MRLSSGRNAFLVGVLAVGFCAATSQATVIATPGSVSAFPTQTTSSISLSLTFPTPPPGTTGTFAVAGMPAGTTTIPAAIAYSFPAGSMTASASFAFSVGGATTPGTYPITLTDSNKAGPVTVTLTVNTPSFAATAAPNPVTLTIGGPSQPVVVSTTTDPGFAAPSITYSFSGFPASILNNGPQTTTLSGNYNPVTFTFSLGAGAASGTYPGTLTGTVVGSGSKNFPVTVVVQQPDIAASFLQPIVSICNGQTAGDSVQLAPLNGYTGTPTLTFSSIPAGITIIPSPLPVAPMPPGETIPFSISASGANSGIGVLTISDAAAGINKTIQLQFNVGAPSFTPAVTPASLTLTAGGSSQSVTASIPVSSCLSSSITVAATGQPSGITITANPATILAPAFAPVSISLQASGTTLPGTYPITFTFSSASVTRSVIVPIMVNAAPDYTLNLNPSGVTIPLGSSGTTSVTINPINGFAGSVSVTSPTAPGVTLTPASFTLLPGSAQTVTIAVGTGAATGVSSLTFSSTAPGISGPRTGVLTLTIGGRPDFSIAATPPSLTIRSGSSATVTVTASAVNGFTGPIAVTTPTIPGLTFAPSNFTLNAGASQQVTVTAGASAVGQGSLQATFTANGSGAPSHQALVIVTVLSPLPVLTAAAPPSLVIGAQSTVVRVAGDFLQPGAQFRSSDPSLILEAANILTPKLADVRMTVRNNASPGPRNLTVSNPDGGTSATPLVILLYPNSSIAAPLDVLAAAIVFPAQGTLIAPTEAVYPRGLLATAGTGTIVGSWQFDGVAFDRFVVNAAGGMPVEVRTNVPVPTSFIGSHTIGIVIESPRKFVSPAIEVVGSADRVSHLTLLAPREGAIIRGQDQLFRWSLVPNCSGYDVEVALPGLSELPDALTPMARFHVAGAEWRPSADDVAAIGPGIHRWRVRPRCSGETELEPSAWQRFAILPQHVDIALQPMTTNARGLRVVHWNSGVTGLLYRVEFLSPAGKMLFSALTSATEYAVPRMFPADTVVRVSAIAPDGSILGTSSAAPLSRRNSHAAIELAQQALVEFGVVEPEDGATITETQPHIAAQWKGAATADQIMLLVDDTDITQVAKVTSTSVAYDSLIALASGLHTAALAVSGNVKRWTFTIAGPAGAEQPPPTAPAAAGQAQPRGDWVLAPLGTITLIRDGNHDARAQLSALTDLNDKSLSNKATGDVSLDHNFENNKTVQQSRNWAADMGVHQGPALAESARVGFAPPDFFDQAQLLSAGLPRGGVQAKMTVPVGSVSYYQTFTSRPAGLVTGLFGPEQKMKGASYQIPFNPRWDFRIVGLNVDEAPDVNSAGGRGRALGIFGRFTIGMTLNAIVEAARGDFKPNVGSDESRRKGTAFRLGLTGLHGTLNYALNLRRTDADFVNPANRAMTPAGVPDRTGGDLTIGKLIGFTSISVQLRHLQDGSTANLAVPRTREDGGMASLMRAFGPHVSLALSGNVTKDKGDAKPEIELPRADRELSGGTGTLSELFGRFNVAQTVSRQSLRDHVNSLNDQTTTATTLSGGGQFSPNLNLVGVLSGTRTAGSPIVGKTDQYLASVQPMISIPFLFLILQPRASYSTSKNDLVESKTTTEDYQALVTFAPRWLNSILTIQLSGDWSRNTVTGELVPAPFIHRYAATFTLHSRAGAGPAYVQGGLMPGVQPVAPPNPAAAVPGNPK